VCGNLPFAILDSVLWVLRERLKKVSVPSTMELTEENRTMVARWIEEGLTPGEVQKKLKEDVGVSLTYLDLRLLLDDLKVVPKESEPDPEPKAPEEALPTTPDGTVEEAAPLEPMPGGAGKVSVTIDQITRPNALISGKVTFSDGQQAEWSLDTAGRLGLNPAQPGYRPSQEDVMAFQVELQKAAQSSGL